MTELCPYWHLSRHQMLSASQIASKPNRNALNFLQWQNGFCLFLTALHTIFKNCLRDAVTAAEKKERKLVQNYPHNTTVPFFNSQNYFQNTIFFVEILSQLGKLLNLTNFQFFKEQIIIFLRLS